MRLMTFNVLRNGEHEAGHRQALIRDVVAAHSPDILCLQEGGDGDFWQTIIADQGYVFSANLPGQYQPSIYSRIAPDSCRLLDWFSPGGIAMTLPYRDDALLILNLHLPWKVSQDADRTAVIDRLFADHIADAPRYILICGDFNSRTLGEPGDPWLADYLSRFADLDTPVRDDQWVAATTALKTRGFTDCYRHLHDDPGYSVHPSVENMRAKVPDMLPRFSPEQLDQPFLPPAARIDYIFANAPMLARLRHCHIDTSPATHRASDHAPFIAHFTDPG